MINRQTYGSAVIILSMVSIYHPSYAQQNWHQSLVMIAIGILGTLMNTIGAQHLPLLEGIVLVFHIFGFFCIIIPLWVLAPKAPASEVFGGFNDFGGWGSIGAACFVGSVAAAGSFGGSDAAAHLSEETKDASKSVRKSILSSVSSILRDGSVQNDGCTAAAALVLPFASFHCHAHYFS
jgi:choline transport protein